VAGRVAGVEVLRNPGECGLSFANPFVQRRRTGVSEYLNPGHGKIGFIAMGSSEKFMKRFVPRVRQGFTLVELLAVIAIITVLVAILLAGVLPLLNKGPALMVTNDITGLSAAINSFKASKGVFPPSKMILHADPSKIDATSLAYLNAIWTRLDWNDPRGLDWSGTGITTKRGLLSLQPYHLEGDQCLVFFLGGIPSQNTPGCLGFSSNSKNPTDLSSGVKESFYQFDVTRLYTRITGNPFYSFGDPWPTKDLNTPPRPYAYFSSGKHQNGYNAVSDCLSLMPRGPYYDSATGGNTGIPIRYYYPSSFQIISAGKDGQFGSGGLWPWYNIHPPRPDMITPAEFVVAQDDQVNFTASNLGVVP